MLTILISLAMAAEVDVGVGVRSTPSVWYQGHYGLRATGRVLLCPFVGFEAGVYGRFPGSTLSGLTQTSVMIAYEGDQQTRFVVPADLELGSVDLLVVASPWRRPHGPGLALWAAGAVGATGFLITHPVAGVNPDYANGDDSADPAVLDPDQRSMSVNVGPAAGLSFEASLADRVALRILGLERFYVAPEPGYGDVQANGEPVPLANQVYASGVVELDVMVHL